MEENEKKWCIRGLFGGGIGFIAGAIVKRLLVTFIEKPDQSVLIALTIPFAMIIGLSIVYWRYQKEKEDNFS